MARPRLDRPVMGRPQRVIVRPRKKDGAVLYHYACFVDEARQEHAIPGSPYRTTDRGEARRMAEDWLAGCGSGLLLVRSTRAALDLWLDEKGLRPGDSTFKDYYGAVKAFCKWVSWKNIRRISWADWDSYLSSMVRRGLTERARKIRAVVQMWAAWMVENSVIDTDFTRHPRTGGRRQLPRRKKSRTIRWIRFSLFVALRAALRDARTSEFLSDYSAANRQRLYELEVAVELGSLGLMPDEIAEVRRFDIDGEGQELHVRGGKTPYRDRYVDLDEASMEVLLRHGVFDLHSTAHAVATHFVQEGKRFHSARLIQQVANRLGILDAQGKSFVLYTLRRSCGVWLAHDDTTDANIERILGHAPGSPQVARYREALPKRRLLERQRRSRRQQVLRAHA